MHIQKNVLMQSKQTHRVLIVKFLKLSVFVMNNVKPSVKSAGNLICNVSMYAQTTKLLNAKILRNRPMSVMVVVKRRIVLCQENFILLVLLIKEKHQSIGHIYAIHAEKLGCSRRTLYSYINDWGFDVRTGDLRRAVRYKKRRKTTQTSVKGRSYRQGHN